MDQQIAAFDLSRMLLGNEPPLFLAEIVVRTVIVYAYTFALVRWLGGRSIAQLSVVEFLLVIALGSAVGDSMFYPDVPLLHALLVITVVVLVNKGIDKVMARISGVENFIDAPPIEVLHRGKLIKEALAEAGYGPREVFEQLRVQGIRNTGEVETAVLESSGRLSVFKLRKRVTGIELLPIDQIDNEAIKRNTVSRKEVKEGNRETRKK